MIENGRPATGFRFLLIIAGLTLIAPVFGDHVPAGRSGEIDYQMRIFVSREYGDFEPVGELVGRIEEGEFRYRSATLGLYYRAMKNLKIGAFYQLASGLRHDDDWIDTNPGWEWQSTDDRLENILILDASPRFLFDFLPGENWVFMVKNRYSYNTYNGNQTLMIRPGLSYIHLKDREPVVNIGFQYGLYMPLNFSDVPIYEHDRYLNVIYHLNQRIKLEFFGAYRTRIWTSSEDIATAGESDYEADDSVIILGTGLILRF